MPHETVRSTNTRRVLGILQRARTPLTAYEILSAAREHDINAPPTVYRALNKLIEQGLAHRLESLNAYMACTDESHHHAAAVFAICNGCGQVEELHDSRAISCLKSEALEKGFTINDTVIELKGVCVTCAGVGL